MHRATSYAFGAFAATYGYALQWGMVVIQLLTAPTRSVIHYICISDQCFIWVSMWLFLELCTLIFIMSFNKQCQQQVAVPCHFLNTEAKTKNLQKANKHNSPYLSSTLVVRNTIISIFQWTFSTFHNFLYCIALHYTLAHFGALW